MQIMHKLLIVNRGGEERNLLFMVIENVEHTFVTHDIQIDEHSEKEVKNKIEGAKEQGDERIIT